MPVTSAAKLASHILRGAAQSAANAAHNSASTLKSAFQGSASSGTAGAGSSSTSSSSSSASGWTSGLSSGGSSAGAGAGGAKYHAGPGANFSYQNTATILSQTTGFHSNDGNTTRNDDDEELRRQKAYHLRLRAQGGITSRIAAVTHNLTALQMQARFKQAFASSSRGLLTGPESQQSHSDLTGIQDAQEASKQTSGQASTPSEIPPPPESLSSDAPHPQTNSEAGTSPKDDHDNMSPATEALYQEFKRSIRRYDIKSIRSCITAFQSLPASEKSTALCNLQIEALSKLRKSGQPINKITDVYIEMLDLGIHPNRRTFDVLARALCERDVEIQSKLFFSFDRVQDPANQAQPNNPDPTSSEAQSIDPVTTSEARDKHKILISKLRNHDSINRVLIKKLKDRGSPQQSQLEKLNDRDNFIMALTLMNVCHKGKGFIDVQAYNAILDCCALRGDVATAINVLDLLENNPDAIYNAVTYKNLIRTFANDNVMKLNESIQSHNLRRMTACQKVFSEFLEACQTQDWNNEHDGIVWSAMIDAHFRLGDVSGAVALFEKLVQGGSYVPAVETPAVSAMVNGFLFVNNLTAALRWFFKISFADPNHQLPRPGKFVIERLIHTMCGGHHGLVWSLLRVYQVYLDQYPDLSPKTEYFANVISFTSDAAGTVSTCANESKATVLLDKALNLVLQHYSQHRLYLERLDPLSLSSLANPNVKALCNLSNRLISSGRVADAASVFTYASVFLPQIELSTKPFDELVDPVVKLAHAFFGMGDENTKLAASPQVHLYLCAEMVAPTLQAGGLLDETFAKGLTQLYRLAQSDGSDNGLSQLPFTTASWKMILDAFCFEEQHLRELNLDAFKNNGLCMVLDDLDKLCLKDDRFVTIRSSLDVTKVVELIGKRYGQDGLQAIPASWIPSPVSASPAVDADVDADADATSEPEVSSVVSTQDASSDLPASSSFSLSPVDRQDLPPVGFPLDKYSFPPVQVVDTDFGRMLLDINRRQSPPKAAPQMYDQVLEHMKLGNFAHPEGIAALIATFGRLGDVERVYELYAMSQHVLKALAGDRLWQLNGWLEIENHMIQALSHSGHVDEASIHRHRIIGIGRAPSASSYASLIATIRDTTDDASIAQELFQESQRFRVTPNVYLFNTVISKLSRARKADQALQLFDDMQSKFGISPTSVTYGSVINACTRIGDERRAVEVFRLMEKDPKFQPRVPPYNTMMQFYVESVASRDNVLKYFKKMKAARVQPSAHTYKLLLDAYGSIRPVWTERMDRTFQDLVADPKVDVQGTHWASLINSYGCLVNDLDQAISIFDSIATHPSTLANRTGAKLPDSIAFEALLAVFVAHHRTDLMRKYLEQMKRSGIKMTAYIVNLLIRAYSMDGAEGLEEARNLFESMSEPGVGVAAAGNHPPRAQGAGAPVTPGQLQASRDVAATRTEVSDPSNPFSLVQREPSTYESMIRAELGYGDRDRALRLVERMEARAFPPALIIRARSLVSDGVQGAAAMDYSNEAGLALDSDLTAKFTFGSTSPKVSQPNWSKASPPKKFGFNSRATMANSTTPNGFRRASTMAATSSGTSNPAPGPPKPNSPFTIFDRKAKTMQKDRAALRQLIELDAATGTVTLGDESTRGQASRQTDYVRNVMAESLAERVQDIKREFPVIVELGSGAGYLRHYLDGQGTGCKKIIMCDTSEAMLNRDRHLDDQFAFEFERRVVDEELLPFEPGSLDCVVVSGGLHWTNDLPGVLIQIRRALKPDGVFVGSMCGGDTLFELRTSLQLAEQEREGGISPRVSPMADTRDIASLLSRAGFTIPTVDVDEVSIGYPSIYELISDLRDMGESNAVINRRPTLHRDTLLSAGAIYQALHGIQQDGKDMIPATFSLIYMIGWAPAPSQPKPLEKGSAKVNLKDVLSNSEDGDVQKKAEQDLEKKELQRMLKTI